MGQMTAGGMAVPHLPPEAWHRGDRRAPAVAPGGRADLTAYRQDDFRLPPHGPLAGEAWQDRGEVRDHRMPSCTIRRCFPIYTENVGRLPTSARSQAIPREFGLTSCHSAKTPQSLRTAREHPLGTTSHENGWRARHTGNLLRTFTFSQHAYRVAVWESRHIFFPAAKILDYTIEISATMLNHVYLDGPQGRCGQMSLFCRVARKVLWPSFQRISRSTGCGYEASGSRERRCLGRGRPVGP